MASAAKPYQHARLLPIVAFEENRPKTAPLPPDTILKRIVIRLSGWLSVTYASGSPVADAASTFDRICPTVEVAIGGKTVKSIRPFMAQQQQLLLDKVLGERRHSTSASLPTTKIATTDGGFTFPSTTQYVVVNETITIYFECMWAYNYGREFTHLDLRGVNNAEVRFNFVSFANIQRADDSTSVTYGANTLEFQISLVEAKEAVGTFADFRETTVEESFTAETERFVNLPLGNHLAGLMFVVRDGDSARTLSNKAVREISLVIGGSDYPQKWRFLDLQSENRNRYGVSAPFASNVSRLDGTAYLPIIKNGDIRTALSLEQSTGILQCQAGIKTAPSSGTDAATYTNAVKVAILMQEIVYPKVG